MKNYTTYLALTVGLGLFLIGALSACKIEEPQRKKPNVLFILADDYGYHDVGVMGSTYYETPHIDGIANSGMIFTNGYAACQVCSPSRAAIMTGKYPARLRITDWIGAKTGQEWRLHNRQNKLLPAGNNDHLPHEDISLAEAMKEAGYKTFFAGKWHLGNKGSWPEDHGFDINRGGWEKGSPIGGFYSPWKNPNLENRKAGESLPIRLGEETAQFIKEHKDTSFFAFLSFYAVHGPIQTTEKKWNKYRTKAEAAGIAESGFIMERRLPIRQEQDNPIYAGLVESMDDAIGIVMNTLKEQGLDKNTIVIFTSDNGGVASGDSYSTSNLPLRGGKGYQWEGGIREPYFIHVPWLNHKGTKTEVLASGMDFYPTILDLAGIKLRPEQHMDGQSLAPVLMGQSIPERPLYWHYPHYGNQGGDPSTIIRDGNWKMIFYYEDGKRELYDLATDPEEKTDIADQHPDLITELTQKMEDWLEAMDADFPEEDPQYNEKLAQERQVKMEKELWPRLEERRKKYLRKDFNPDNNWWDSQVTKD